MSEVKAGQIWADCDHRMVGRTVKIDYVTECGRYALVITLTKGKHGSQRTVGKRTRILISRFTKSSTGFELVQDV